MKKKVDELNMILIIETEIEIPPTYAATKNDADNGRLFFDLPFTFCASWTFCFLNYEKGLENMIIDRTIPHNDYLL